VRRARVAQFTVVVALASTVYAYNHVGSASITPDRASMQMAGNHMPMLTATEANSFTAQADPLPSAGWTVTASDEESGNPASNAIDGDPTTFWHSEYSPTTVPLPHSITIDMHALQDVSGLTYLPRQDGSSNGNIGEYSISVSQDGTHWGAPVATGTWADNSLQKSAVFSGVLCEYVRLTALTEAFNRGPWTSVAELGLLGDPPMGPALPRAGWTVSADSEAPGDGVGNLLDGDADTIWATADAAPLPHSITIDMHKTQLVSGLSYLPRQDGILDGTIGQYAIRLSTDGIHWSKRVAVGTWADDATEKYATFTPQLAQFVRLTALTDVGDTGSLTSAAEINVSGVAPSAAVGGSWSAPIGFPLVPVSAVLLPDDKLLTFSADDDMDFSHDPGAITNVAVLDLRTGQVTEPYQVNTNDQMFCTGLALLPNGDVIINGGSGDSATTIYDPTTDTWTQGPLMNIPRAYNGDTTLSTGQVLTLGGSWAGGIGGKNGEIYTANGGTGSWQLLPGVLASAILTADPGGVYRADNHPWLFAQPGGTVFQAGPSKQMNWITTTGQGSITGAGRRGTSADAMNGNAVMYGVGQIVTMGGATAYEDAGSVTDVQATSRAYTINIAGGPHKPVIVKRVANMAYARAFSNSVVLPNGEVLVVGGQQHPQTFDDTGGVLSPELWNPATGKFTIMAPEAIPRDYHSVAILLPDGRVFSGGGGLCGTCTSNHPDGQIYSPPYLFRANGRLRVRPVILRAPARATHGSLITVRTNSPTPRFSLIRMSAVTHSLNNDQRLIPLTPTTVSGTRYTLRLPTRTGILLPGNYMLFALSPNGTPSVAKIINIQ
jgi:galactose oxidase